MMAEMSERFIFETSEFIIRFDLRVNLFQQFSSSTRRAANCLFA
ncbi:hypothetical protein Bealeia1_02051 (plasmid) [Candidatus Bealeia paramacronuclearis]|uniref:Uncharacterized protein n=1 Tax=Candidatus Bealeia paramacronuclearis TaxID=1921001 RepID=A0ABZ2C9Q9_9PROT